MGTSQRDNMPGDMQDELEDIFDELPEPDSDIDDNGDGGEESPERERDEGDEKKSGGNEERDNGGGDGREPQSSNPCLRILQALCKADRLVGALKEKAALRYLHELALLREAACDSGDLPTAVLNLYAVETLDQMPARQIIQLVNEKLLRMNIEGPYQHCALRATSQSLNVLMLEKLADLPFAETEEIQRFLCTKLPCDVLSTFYAHYLCQIIYYHYNQEAPRHQGPQGGEPCQEFCEDKGKVLADILNDTCRRTRQCDLDDLPTFQPEVISDLITRAEDRLQKGLTRIPRYA